MVAAAGEPAVDVVTLAQETLAADGVESVREEHDLCVPAVFARTWVPGGPAFRKQYVIIQTEGD